MKIVTAVRKAAAVSCLLGTSIIAGCGGNHVALPAHVKLQQIDGGSDYFAKINPGSAWMDHHILLGSWLEQPANATEVAYDHAAGQNIYWNLAGFGKICNGVPCVAGYPAIRNEGMRVSAPGAGPGTGDESVAYEGTDEADMEFGPGWDGWDKDKNVCVPADGKCGFTIARWFYTGKPASLGSPGYPLDRTIKQQGYGKGVLFWETAKQAAEFLRFSDILSADSYWMTDGSLGLPTLGGCSLFPANPKICGNGGGAGLTSRQRQLPANYAFNVTKLERLQALNGAPKPIVVDIETGCPFVNSDACITPAAMTAAAWHALIAGARGIIWFQHNFGGPCIDFRTIIDGSNPASGKYDCQQTPGVTLHDVVVAVTKFGAAVKSLNAVLLSPFADGFVHSRSNVSYMAKYWQGNFYIFAASGQPGVPPPVNQKVTFTIAGTGKCVADVLNEKRSVSVSGGKFSDTFSTANSVHIYRINC